MIATFPSEITEFNQESHLQIGCNFQASDDVIPSEILQEDIQYATVSLHNYHQALLGQPESAP